MKTFYIAITHLIILVKDKSHDDINSRNYFHLLHTCSLKLSCWLDAIKVYNWLRQLSNSGDNSTA